MNGVIYCRVSSKEQVEGTSLESQESACRDYAGRHQINVVKVFVEQGESAKFADRTQLLELMEHCRKREYGVSKLLVWKVDRLARNVADHFNIKSELRKRGVEVISVSEPIDSNPEGKLLETILAGFAQFDNDLRAVRTVNGMRRKIQEGIFPWKPPLGYAVRAQGGAKKNEPDRPEERIFSLLQKAWTTFATGAYTKAELIRLMTAWGIRTRSGEPVSKQTIDNMLRDPFYAGMVRDPWSGEEHQGLHIPLVSRETFAKIQGIINKRRQTRSVRHFRIRPELPLRAFVRCSECEHYLTGASSRGRSRHYPYYRCSQKMCTSGVSYRAAAVHHEFGAFLQSISPTKEGVVRLRERIAHALRRRDGQRRVAGERRRIELERLKKRQEQLIQMRMEQIISSERFSEFSARLSAQIADLDSEKNDDREDRLLLESIEEISAPAARLKETWLTLPPVLQQRFQRVAFPVGYVMGRIGTAEMGCLFSTFARTTSQKSIGVPLKGQILNRISQDIKALSDILQAASQPLGAAA